MNSALSEQSQPMTELYVHGCSVGYMHEKPTVDPTTDAPQATQQATQSKACYTCWQCRAPASTPLEQCLPCCAGLGNRWQHTRTDQGIAAAA